MSARRPDRPTANRVTTPTAIAANRPTGRPTVLPSITHPPDLSAVIITDQQGPIRQNEQTDWPSPARTVGTLPADNEILNPHRAPAAAVDPHADNLGARRHRAVPGTV